MVALRGLLVDRGLVGEQAAIYDKPGSRFARESALLAYPTVWIARHLASEECSELTLLGICSTCPRAV